MKVPISILVPIKNEAANLPRCLRSVAWADEIIVVDSQSADGSAEMAAAHGARVVQFQFNGIWPKKKNWALETVPFQHEWVFILDADEVLPPEAEAEIRQIVTCPETGYAGYWINRRFLFMGKWLKHSYYPNWNLRLFKHRLGRYEKLADVDTASGDNEVHEHVIVEGKTGFLRCEMDHYAFPSVEVFVEKHNRYSNWEARVAAARLLSGSEQHIQSQQVGWRRRLKRLSHRLPCRPLLRFLYIYIWQRGFLDGREGYYFARLHAIYEFLSVAKTCELLKAETGPGDALPASRFPATLSALAAPLFWGGLAGVLFFSLRPSPNGERVGGIPREVAQWINGHDGWSNCLAFAFLAFFGFCVTRKPDAGKTRPGFREPSLLESRWRRWGMLCALIFLLEFVQLWIPGRVFDWRDLAVGWFGSGCALLAWQYFAGKRRVSERPGEEAGRTDQVAPAAPRTFVETASLPEKT